MIEAHMARRHGRASTRVRLQRRLTGLLSAVAFLLFACGGSVQATAPGVDPGVSGAPAAASLVLPAPSALPGWFSVRLTDVRTGADFSIGDFAGKVVLIETMAEWCPTCIEQQAEVQRLHDLLGGSSDLISVSLDIDVNEDAASLRDYAVALDHDWHYAVAPLEVARALGNLYSAEYLNPPFSPMLAIDRQGNAIQLPYGLKKAETLQEMLDPYLAS